MGYLRPTPCAMMFEMQDYETYLTTNGCVFGSFTCCPEFNRTILDTFSRTTCMRDGSDICTQHNVLADVQKITFMLCFIWLVWIINKRII